MKNSGKSKPLNSKIWGSDMLRFVNLKAMFYHFFNTTYKLIP
jgi:hypothetical protein